MLLFCCFCCCCCCCCFGGGGGNVTGNSIFLLTVLFIIWYLQSFIRICASFFSFFPWNVQVVGFSLNQVAVFIAVVCVTTVFAQTILLSTFMSWFGYKYTILMGLFSQALQLAIYGIWTTKWLVNSQFHFFFFFFA